MTSGGLCAASCRASLPRHGFHAGGLGLLQCKSDKHRCGRRWKISSKRPIGVGGQIVAASQSTEQARVANIGASKSTALSFTLSGKDEASGYPYALSAFLRQPAGRQSMLNARALRKIEQLENDLYRCYLGTTEIFGISVTPIIDLHVTVAETECVVEMLSCRFEGSDQVQEINRRFSASLCNRLQWESVNTQQLSLKNDVDLKVSLEVFTLPFTLLPLSAVEVPGNTVLQALLDRLAPLFLTQLEDDYNAWVSRNSRNANGKETNGASLHHPS